MTESYKTTLLQAIGALTDKVKDGRPEKVMSSPEKLLLALSEAVTALLVSHQPKESES